MDDILLNPDGSGGVVGWAADRLINRPAKAVHIYAGETWLTAGRPEFSRPDVAEFLGDPGFRNAGFAIEVRKIGEYSNHSISAYAELSDGTLCKLKQS